MEEKDLSLEELKNNVINWYEFKNTDAILVIGNVEEQIISFLRLKFNRVEVNENIKNIKFDYIFIMDYFDENKSDEEIKKEINEKSKFLKDDGEILCVFKNKLGVKEFVDNNIEGFSKDRILNLISGFNYKFYYMLPSQENVNIIFSDEYLPSPADIGRNLHFSEESNGLGKIEDDAYYKILNGYKNDFKNVANVFFVELSKKEILNEVKAVYFSNIRNEEYRIVTKIFSDKAVKTALSEKSLNHIKQIEKNIDILNKAGIKTLDKYQDDKIISKLAINAKNLDEKFLKYYKSGNEEYKHIIEKLKKDILLKLKKTDKRGNVFEKYKIEVPQELLDEMTFVKHGLWDLNFRNIFIIDGKYYVYDQEWYEENMPIEFILYRGILVFENMKFEEKMNLMEELNISRFSEFFDKLEKALSDKITNKEAHKLYVNSLIPSKKENLENKYKNLQKELERKKRKS